eukprot:gnl/TRDRNA2_/TRDRNA2_177510_c1_seq15.p2 gnl/TRDRNA2_/TRDRNA2_177510_c1~~gnl/TRDRNA2_/TRDRNA2_177510_c1_seq15.p2  ORF type:complete len:179 (-),score=17.87 gnl/TRDRNA2_/TRDRNA2_177510_c1_seq15:211-708(-)
MAMHAMRSAGFNSTLSYGVDIASYAGEGARFVIASSDFPDSLSDIVTAQVGDAVAGARGYMYLSMDVMERSLAHTWRRLKGSGGGGGFGGGLWTIVGIAVGVCACGGFCFVGWKAKKGMDADKKSFEERSAQLKAKQAAAAAAAEQGKSAEGLGVDDVKIVGNPA